MNLTTELNQVTMTSIELVAFINSLRGEGESELRHDHFMTKVPKVLGEKAAPKFSGTAQYTNGGGALQARAIYNLPKREATLLAMSYSYTLSAQVYDHMTALEAQLQNKATSIDYQEAAGLMLIAGAMADMLRVSESARLGMARAVVKEHAPKALSLVPAYAIDCPMSVNIPIGTSSLVSHSLSHLLKENGITESAVYWNKKLLSNGFIQKEALGTTKTYWSVTTKGLEYGKNMVCDKSQKTTQPYWYDSTFILLLSKCV